MSPWNERSGRIYGGKSAFMSRWWWKVRSRSSLGPHNEPEMTIRITRAMLPPQNSDRRRRSALREEIVRIIRAIVMGLATVLLLAAPQLAKAQDFPTRPVRI